MSDRWDDISVCGAGGPPIDASSASLASSSGHEAGSTLSRGRSGADDGMMGWMSSSLSEMVLNSRSSASSAPPPTETENEL